MAAALIVGLAAMLAAAQAWAQGPCVGDCLNQGRVTVSDMVLGVNIVLEMQPPSACPNFQNARGVVDVAQLIQGVNHLLRGCDNVSPTPTRTPLFSGKKRTFVVAPGTPQASVAQSTTGLFSSGTANNNAATAVCGKLAAGGQSCDTPAELQLLLDDEDMGDGIHDLVLENDATVEIGIVDGSRICLKFIASLTEGYIACDGGVPYDVAATRDAGQSGESFTFTTNLGPDAAAGSANLIVSSFYRILPAGDTTPCGEGEYTGTLELPFTTTTGTATIEDTDLELAVSGQAFSCDNFETPGSGGILTVPLPANQAPVGNVVNALRFGEQVP